MPLSPEFCDFYRRWLDKSNNYNANSLSDYFDRYFSLFIAFNRLYAESTFILARNGQINISKRTSFPDSDAAKDYVLQYMSSTYFIDQLEADNVVMNALEEVKNLIKDNRFYIKLDMVTGGRQPNKDAEMIKGLESRSKNKRAYSILDLLYSVRCNMFHGHKGFDEVQIDLLRPLCCILKFMVEILYDKLNRENSQPSVAGE